MKNGRYLDVCPRFDASTHTKTGDGWYYNITVEEDWIYLQADNYNLLHAPSFKLPLERF